MAAEGPHPTKGQVGQGSDLTPEYYPMIYNFVGSWSLPSLVLVAETTSLSRLFLRFVRSVTSTKLGRTRQPKHSYTIVHILTHFSLGGVKWWNTV